MKSLWECLVKWFLVFWMHVLLLFSAEIAKYIQQTFKHNDKYKMVYFDRRRHSFSMFSIFFFALKLLNVRSVLSHQDYVHHCWKILFSDFWASHIILDSVHLIHARGIRIFSLHESHDVNICMVEKKQHNTHRKGKENKKTISRFFPCFFFPR